MNWYLTKIVYQIICGEGDHTPQFDEQLRLIEAASLKEAFLKAQSIGKNEEETFFNDKQQMVQWKFISISELYQLNELIDGAELYSRIEEKDDAGEYIDFLNRKAGELMQGGIHQLLQPALN